MLKLNHKVDEANASCESYKVDAEMSKIQSIKLEERTNYLKQQYDEMVASTKKIQEEFDSKINDKQMQIWKHEMTERSLTKEIHELGKEIERLSKVKNINESIARLPTSCIEAMNS